MLKEQLSNKKYIMLSIIILGVIGYFLLGDEWIHLEDDSLLYINCDSAEGVSPIYSLFLFGVRLLFGKNKYLTVVVIIQSLLAIYATGVFSLFIIKHFKLGYIGALSVFFLCSLPYIIYLPSFGITHCILTEGISYSLFYLFFTQIMKYVYEKQIINLFGIVIFTIVLGMTRSQLVLLVFYSAIIISGIIIANINKSRVMLRKCIWLGSFIGVLAGCFIVIAGGKKFYSEKVLPAINVDAEIVEVASLVDTKVESYIVEVASNSGQLKDVIKIKAFFEANPDDIALFTDAREKQLFSRIYSVLDDNKCLHNYVRKGLYSWMDIIKGDIPVLVSQCIHDYALENPYDNITYADIATKMAVRLFIKHVPQIILHSLRIMLMSIVASVFFQMEKIYLLCHIIAIGVYIVFILLMIKNKNDKMLWQLSKKVLSFLMVLIVFTNLAFLGIQRYVVYGMGIFYIVLFLQLRKIYYDYIAN